MNPNDLVGEVLEQGANAVAQTPKAVGQQVGVIPVSDNSQNAPSVDTNTQAINESLYGKSQPQGLDNTQQKAPQATTTGSMTKTLQEQAQMEAVRKSLHEEYFQREFNRPAQEEERPAERVERQEQEEKFDLQKKEMEKPPDLATQRAAQRVENNPGASG